MRVLVVEDDISIRRLVREGLEHEGIDVAEAGSLKRATHELQKASFDVVILDLRLPDGSGMDVIEYLTRTSSSTHVIVLSGAVAEFDRVRALALGADDYVAKPFFARELIARVLAVQRRRNGVPAQVLRIGRLEIDLAARQLLIDGAVAHVTHEEFELLACLVARPGHVFGRGDLLRSMWPSRTELPTERTVSGHIANLRAQIESDPSHPQLIRTVRGAGYRFDPPADDSRFALDTMEIADVGSWIAVDCRIVEADAAAAVLLGVADVGDLIGQQVMDLVAPRSRRAAEDRMELITTGSLPRSQVFAVSDAHGVEVPVEVTSSEVQWHGESAVRGEIRYAVDQSGGLRQLVTGVFGEVSDAVIVTDMQNHIRSWNGAAERLYLWTEAAVLGRHLLDIVPWIDGDELEDPTSASSLGTPGRSLRAGRQCTRLGTTIAVRSATNLVKDEDGDPIGMISVNREATVEALASPEQPTADDVADLCRGLDQHEFEVHYQPVVDLANGVIITVEALVRWRHPTRGLLSPVSFIHTAERSGAIIELGTTVLSTACIQTAAWRQAGAEIQLAVNLSARELADPSLVHRIARTLARAGLDPHALWLEVTEGALVEDVDEASVILHALAAQGIGISIDDFGTGWASLTYLRQFPVDVLKIDRSFVSGIDHDPSNAAIARSILSLGAELNLAVVAEGIETIAEERTLRALGCTVGQGFLYGRARPAAQVDISRMHRRAMAAPAPDRREGTSRAVASR